MATLYLKTKVLYLTQILQLPEVVWFLMMIYLISLGISFSTYLYELLIIEILFAEGGHRRDISPKLIYHKFQEEWLFCCLLLFEELFKRLLIPSLSQKFYFFTKWTFTWDFIWNSIDDDKKDLSSQTNY